MTTIPATTTDIENRWRRLTGQEVINAQAFLEDAWWLLNDRRPALVANLASGAVKPEMARRTLVAMVLRVLKNPDGYEQESIDDWSGRRSDLVASGLLTVTDDELYDVTPRTTGHRQSVRLVVYGDA